MNEARTRDTQIGEYIQPPVLVNLTETARTVARIMASKNSSCAIVMLNDQPVGIVTEWDLLTRVVILGRECLDHFECHRVIRD